MGGFRRAWSVVRERQLSPDRFRLVTALAVWAMVLVIVSGAAVRLTGSGLGCADWPNCTNTDVVAPLQFHAWVEFGNRLINAFVTVAAFGALGAALLRAPRRRDLTFLSAGLLLGLVAEVALGAVVVGSGLSPGWVTVHFLLGMVILADAVILHHRAGQPDTAGPQRRRVSRDQLVLGRLLLLNAAVVIVLGTIVTSTGPHGGDPKAPRFGFSLHHVAQMHGTSVEVFLALCCLTLWRLVQTGAPPDVLRRAQVLLLVLIAQGAIGYAQYLSGDPAWVVQLHIIGAIAVLIAVLGFNLVLTGRPVPVPTSAPVTDQATEPALTP